jgi:hypothetical protein
MYSVISVSPFGPVHFQRQLSCAASLLRAEDQIGVSDRVILMSVSQEHNAKIDWQERFNALPVRSSRAAHHSGPEVN